VVSGSAGEAQCGGSGDIEVVFVDEDAVVQDGRGAGALELMIGVAGDDSGFEAGEGRGADEDRASEGGRGDGVADFAGISGRAIDAVAGPADGDFVEAGEPALGGAMLERALVPMALHGFELLAEFDAGVSEVVVEVAGTTEGFAGGGDVGGEGAEDGVGLKETESAWKKRRSATA